MLCHVYLFRVLLRIFGFMIIILYLLISCLSTCVLFHQSPALIWSCYESSLLDIICCISACSCMLVPTTRFSMHVYDSDLLIHVCLPMLAIWLSHHHSPGSSNSSGSSCPGFGAWSVWILPVADQSDAALAWFSSRRPEPHPFRPSFSALEFSCYASEPLFVLFIFVHLFVFSQLRISVM